MAGALGPAGPSEPSDDRRVIQLPRATCPLAAWLVCFSIALAIIWFSPLGIEQAAHTMCKGIDLSGLADRCVEPFTEPARQFALPNLVLRAAALGTVFWVVYLTVRAVRSRVRFKVG